MGERVTRFLLVKVTQIIVFFCASEEFAFCPLKGVMRAKKKHFQHLLPCYYNRHAYSLYSLQYNEDIN